MKKLSITKEQFEKSKYFTNKYGKLAFVSESGKLFKTDKGHVLRFDEGGQNVLDWRCPDRTHNNLPPSTNVIVRYMKVEDVQQ